MCILPFCDEIKNFRTSNSYSSKKDLHFSSVIYFVKKKSHICNEYFQITMNLNCSKRFSISSINTQVKYWERVKKIYTLAKITQNICAYSFVSKHLTLFCEKTRLLRMTVFFLKCSLSILQLFVYIFCYFIAWHYRPFLLEFMCYYALNLTVINHYSLENNQTNVYKYSNLVTICSIHKWLPA